MYIFIVQINKAVFGQISWSKKILRLYIYHISLFQPAVLIEETIFNWADAHTKSVWTMQGVKLYVGLPYRTFRCHIFPLHLGFIFNMCLIIAQQRLCKLIFWSHIMLNVVPATVFDTFNVFLLGYFPLLCWFILLKDCFDSVRRHDSWTVTSSC